jgi:hypothetical protein
MTDTDMCVPCPAAKFTPSYARPRKLGYFPVPSALVRLQFGLDKHLGVITRCVHVERCRIGLQWHTVVKVSIAMAHLIALVSVLRWCHQLGGPMCHMYTHMRNSEACS